MSQPLPSPAVTGAALIATYQAQTQEIRDKLAAFIGTVWQSLGSYREADIPGFVKQVLPVVAAAQRQMSALTVGYLGQQRQQAVGRSRSVRVDPGSVSGANARNGADPADVYERPFHLVWRQLDDLPRQSGSIDQAIQAGLDRATKTALDDVQLAKVQTSQQVLKGDSKVVAYRRVLEGDYSCGLCIVASTLRYRKGDLLPIHGGCDCGCAAIYGDEDPGLTIDANRLAAAHAAIQATFGASDAGARLIPGTGAGKEALQYRDVLISHVHGELGPVLGVRGASFIGPNDLNL